MSACGWLRLWILAFGVGSTNYKLYHLQSFIMADALTQLKSFVKDFYVLSDKNTGPSPNEYASAFAPEGELEFVQVGSMVPATTHAGIVAWRCPAWEDVLRRHHRVLGIYPSAEVPVTTDGTWDVLVRGDLTSGRKDGSIRFVTFTSRFKVTSPKEDGKRKVALYQVWLVCCLFRLSGVRF